MKNKLFLLCLVLSLLACNWDSEHFFVGKDTQFAPSNKTNIIFNNGTEPETLDPQMVNGVPEITILDNIFEGLIAIDSDGKVIPAVALSWQTKDNKIWTFQLRTNARWSNGERVTAHDFVYAWQRLADPKTASPVTSLLTDNFVINAAEIINGEKPPVKLGIEALDDFVLQIRLAKPVVFFLETLNHPGLFPVHRKTIEQFADKWTHAGNMVSNGAYQLKSWQINNQIEVVKNPYYWDKEQTQIETVVFLPIVSLINDVINYISGNEDMTANALPPELFTKLKQRYPQELHIDPLACTYYYVLNVKQAPFDDVRVRLALSLTLARDVVTNQLMRQGQEVSYTLTPYFLNHFERITPQWAKWSKEQRTARAKQLLNQAGYNETNPLKFEILYNTLESHKIIALAVAAEWKKQLGFVQIKLNNMEWKTFLDAYRNRQFSMIRRGGCASYNDPSSFLMTQLSDSTDNYGGYHNLDYDYWVKQVFKAGVSDAQRKQYYLAAEKILLVEAPLLTIYSYVQPRLVKPYVKGYKVGPLGNFYFKNLWLEYAKTE